MMYSRFRAFGIYHDLLFASPFFQQELGLNQLNNSGFFLDQKSELNQQTCWCELGICPSAIGAMWPMKIMKTGMERILSISFIYSSWYQDFFSHKLNVQTPDEVFNPNSMLDFNRLDPGVKLWMQFCQDCWLYFVLLFGALPLNCPYALFGYMGRLSWSMYCVVSFLSLWIARCKC